jgi:hypothetical protein
MMFRSAQVSFCLSFRSRLIFGTAFLSALLCSAPVSAQNQIAAPPGWSAGQLWHQHHIRGRCSRRLELACRRCTRKFNGGRSRRHTQPVGYKSSCRL